MEGLQREYGADRVRRIVLLIPVTCYMYIYGRTTVIIQQRSITSPSPGQAYILLKLDADLRSEFTWNTKQIFAYANAQFQTTRNQRSDMVIWSDIIADKVRLSLVVGARRCLWAQHPHAHVCSLPACRRMPGCSSLAFRSSTLMPSQIRGTPCGAQPST